MKLYILTWGELHGLDHDYDKRLILYVIKKSQRQWGIELSDNRII